MHEEHILEAMANMAHIGNSSETDSILSVLNAKMATKVRNENGLCSPVLKRAIPRLTIGPNPNLAPLSDPAARASESAPNSSPRASMAFADSRREAGALSHTFCLPSHRVLLECKV